MTTAIIGTGGIGSVIARRLASGGEAVQLSSADKQSWIGYCPQYPILVTSENIFFFLAD